LFADFFESTSEVNKFKNKLQNAGFDVIVDENLSKNVIKAMELVDTYKSKLIAK